MKIQGTYTTPLNVEIDIRDAAKAVANAILTNHKLPARCYVNVDGSLWYQDRDGKAYSYCTRPTFEEIATTLFAERIVEEVDEAWLRGIN